MAAGFESNLTFTSADGTRVFARRWLPSATPVRAAVQIAHGAAEHSARYRRFADFLNGAGFAAYADDHRGHGETAARLERAGIAGPDGWNGMVRDLRQLSGIIRDEHPGQPLFFFGHSMGSLLAQGVIQLAGGDYRGAILMGTFSSLPALEELLALVETAESVAPEAVCTPFASAFAAFNDSFGPGGTGYEWLSRDAREVRRYVDDPWCGFPFSNALVAGMLRGAKEIWEPRNEARIPKSLPILLVAGDADPVGGRAGESVTALGERYRGLRVADLKVRLYREARHELLNETNRDEVQRDLLSWLEEHV